MDVSRVQNFKTEIDPWPLNACIVVSFDEFLEVDIGSIERKNTNAI